jgi:hypothetical protein
MSDIARRLELLGDVLPLFLGHVKSVTDRNSIGSGIWTIYIRLYVALNEMIVPVRELKIRFSKREFSAAERECADLIKRVLLLFERWSTSSDEDLQNTASLLTVLEYPALQRICTDRIPPTLRRQSDQENQGTLSAIDQVTKSYDRLCSGVGYPKAVERLTEGTPPWCLREHLQILHDTLGKFWSCHCQDPHEGMLFLATHKPPGINGGAEFDLLFGSTQLPTWYEAQVLVTNPSTKNSRVECELYRLPRRKRNVEHVCKTIHKILPNSRLQLVIKDASLYETQSRGAVLKVANLIPSATLFDVLSGPTLNFECKIKFAVIVAYNFLYLCDGPWLPCPWDKRAIKFLESDQSSVIGEILRPLLAANFSATPTPSTLPEGRFHKDQARLALGILLLEIFEQQAIEGLRDEEEDCTDSDLLSTDTNLFTADRIFERIDWDVHEKYAEAVSACLDDADVDGKPWGHIDHCQYIYTRVIKPLEQELEDYCDISIADLDKMTRGDARAAEAATSKYLQTLSPMPPGAPPAQAHTPYPENMFMRPSQQEPRDHGLHVTKRQPHNDVLGGKNTARTDIARALPRSGTVLQALAPLSLYHVQSSNESR